MSREEIIGVFGGRQDVYRFFGNRNELDPLLDCSFTIFCVGSAVYFIVNDDCPPPENPRWELI